MHSHSVGCGCADETGSPEPYSLYKFVEVEGIQGLNCEGDASAVLVPHGDRLRGRESPLRSEDDETMIIRVPFTGEVKLRRVVVGCRGGGRPTRVRLFANREVDFGNVEDVEATQQLTLAEDAEAQLAHQVNAAKFSKLEVLTLYFDENAEDEEHTEIFYIGLEGTYTQRKRQAVHVNYEKVANPQDHANKLHELGGSTANNTF